MKTRTLSLSLCSLALATAGLALGACSDGDGPTVQSPVRWDLVWSDEFNDKADAPINAKFWTHDVGGDGWGNGQLEYNTDRVENVSHDGFGNLRIVARKEAFESNGYTSGRIKTEDKIEQKYGRIEARIKLPTGQGIWPAFWMLGGNFAEVGWPQCGEIDIMEYRGQEPQIAIGSLHGPGYSGGAAISNKYKFPGEEGLDEGFHVFAVEWDPGRITWYVDDVAYKTISSTQVTNRGEWVYAHPFFLLLNVAVGGGFVGPVGADTVFPQTMLIDYVRIFERRQ
jgi:beta-glucanase (GH16 family)